MQEAYALNDPMMAWHVLASPRGDLPSACAWADVDTDHVVLETVKKAESEFRSKAPSSVLLPVPIQKRVRARLPGQ